MTVLYLVQFVLPLAIVAVTAFQTSAGPGVITSDLTLGNFHKVLTDSFYLEMLGRSFVLALGTAVLTVLLGYPIAWALARSRSWLRTLILVVVMTPLMTSSVVRSFGWMVLFDPESPILRLFGPLADERTGLMYTMPGLLIAMAHVLLPFMVLTLYGIIDRLDPTLEHASLNMGAGRVETFLRVTFPLTLGGVFAGMLLVFATAISTFVTPKLIGGTQYRVLATEIYEQSVQLLNWPLASAMALLLLLIAVLTNLVYVSLTRRIPGGG